MAGTASRLSSSGTTDGQSPAAHLGVSMVAMNPTNAKVLSSLILGAYACARVLQVIYGPIPATGLVAFEVLSALAFALADGARRFGVRGILVFAGICAAVGNMIENIGVATGFPFGHYTFLGVMGPRLFSVPLLLGLAYIGMAYVSWRMAEVLVGKVVPNGSALRVLATPLAASVLMVAWDLAQDPVWSTMLRAWVWRDGGPWFGVPLSNYAGWFLTVFVIFLLFALFLRGRSGALAAPNSSSPVPALVLYLLCAGGNVLQLMVRRGMEQVQDGSGRSWQVAGILSASALVSLLVMGGFALITALRLVEARRMTPRD